MKLHDRDTGSPQFQIERLTERIYKIKKHLRKNVKDNSSRKGLITLVGRRRFLLTFIQDKFPEHYNKLNVPLK